MPGKKKAEDSKSEEKVQGIPVNDETEQLKEQLLRTMAEFDNFRKRTIKEREDLSDFVTIKIITGFLSVIDNFERALNAQTEDVNYQKGMQMIFEQFKSVLNGFGVTEIDALGKPFDPGEHYAIAQVEDPEFGENTVCEIIANGYKIGDKIIRPAMVKVANT